MGHPAHRKHRDHPGDPLPDRRYRRIQGVVARPRHVDTRAPVGMATIESVGSSTRIEGSRPEASLRTGSHRHGPAWREGVARTPRRARAVEALDPECLRRGDRGRSGITTLRFDSESFVCQTATATITGRGSTRPFARPTPLPSPPPRRRSAAPPPTGSRPTRRRRPRPPLLADADAPIRSPGSSTSTWCRCFATHPISARLPSSTSCFVALATGLQNALWFLERVGAFADRPLEDD